MRVTNKTMNDTDICPISGDQHRYFIFKVFEVYELYQGQGVLYGDMQLYRKVEYAVMGCNCGSAIKQRVKQQ